MNYFCIKRIIIAYSIGISSVITVAYEGIIFASDKAMLSYTATRDRAPSRKFVEYTKLSSSKEKALLGKFAEEIKREPHAQGYVTAYSNRAGEAQKSAERAKRYLVKELGLDIRQIMTVDCGYREKLVMELWITPAGAQPPLCDPAVEQQKERAQSNNSLNRTRNRAALSCLANSSPVNSGVRRATLALNDLEQR